MKRYHFFHNRFYAATQIKPIFLFALLITLSVCCPAPQAQAGPAPIETFFVPLPDLQVQTALKAVDTNDRIGDFMRSIISIAATGDGTVIYYDHWEDGYELDLANPVQVTTYIWGDNDPANGMPPGFATDLINAGDVISLDNNISLPRNPAQIRYDGRDKFGGTKAVAVTRASWAIDPGVVLAGAVEVYPVRDYGLRFEVPVGEDLGSDQMFQYVSLMVLAAQDGTDIQIDIDGNGTTDITRTLNQGESYQVDGGIDTGASVIASQPVEAHIITGDIGARYESRFYTLYPVEDWSDSYYSPVGTAADGDETYVFVYNPNGSGITVNYETRVGSGSFVVAAGSTYRYLMPSQSGAHFSSSDGSPLFAIATVGADPGANLVHDWGFSLLPESYLTSMALVGWGPGSNDLSQNGSPIWVTSAAATTVYVDYDGDPASGPLIDANGDRYNVALNLSLLESARVYDNTDNDQTGMRLYTLDGTLITAAWGQDPANAAGGAPYLDLGTTVLPFPIASVEKVSALVVDNNGNGLVDWGDTVEYAIKVNNDGVVVLGGVVAFDPFPTGVTYVTGSTTLNGAPVADETVPPAVTAYPLDEGGLTMPVIVPTGFSTITFRVIVDVGTTIINNSVSISTDQQVLTTDDTVNVNTPDVTDCSLAFSDAGGVSQAVYPENNGIYVTVDDNDRNTDAGSAQSFTVVVVNPDSGDVETITLVETGNDSGVFRNTAALPSSITGGISDEDGILNAEAGNTLQVAYTDPVFGDTCSDTAGISIPTLIKPLYLSETGQGMDRIDPVATGDSTTATTAELSFTSSGTTGMAVWSAAAIPEYNPWDGSAFGTTQNAVTQTIRWRVMAGAAAPTRNEKIVVGIENGGEISGELWNGSSWSKTSLTGLAFVNDTFWWSADVAYEQQSGDAMLVWSGGNTYPSQLRYQVWNGSSWTAPANIAGYGGSEPKQIQLAANPNSDEMVLVVNDSNENDYAFVWNGSSWGNRLLLDSSTADDRTDIFVAYEQQAGRAMVVYGKGTSSVYYRIWNGSSWSGENSVAAPAGVAGYARWTTLGSDPNSNRIVMGVQSSDPDGWVSVWDGTAWEASELLTLNVFVLDSTTSPNVGVSFESSSGRALAVYGRSSQNVFFYRTWVDGSGWSAEQIGPSLGNNSNSLMLYADPNSDQIMLAAQDDVSNLNYVLWNAASWDTPIQLESNTQETKNQPFVFLYDRHIVPAGSSTTFTQSPAMCKDFSMPAGGVIDVITYVTVTSGSMPVDPDISATIKRDGATIETLTDPTVTDLGAGIYRLDWTGVLSGDTTVLADEQVELEITTTEAGVSFEILYDSSTYPSKILLPTTTVILVLVDTLATYDAPYPGGNAITDAENGAVLYLRTTVSDPFGRDDITDLDLSISDPCGGGPLNVTLNDGDVVATGSCSKTYEYAWNTTMCQGNYDIVVVANEGTEGITDSAAIRITLSFTDTGTAGSTGFTDGIGNPVSNYNADAPICAQVIDMDQNSNPAAAETVSAIVTSPQGDSESVILTETGPDTGIFRVCISSSSTVSGAPDDGSLYALPGDVLLARYTDPDDPGDSSDDTALVNTPAADMTLSKLLVDPLDGTAVVNDQIRFDIVVGSPGPTDITSFTVTDTFDAACLSYDAASITPDSIGAGTITWDETELGTLPVGSSVTISVWFTADAACAPTVNSVSATGFDEYSTAVSAGPATAPVTITDPALSVNKILISPNPGPAYVGDPVTFRITLNNTGTSVITTLPLADTFSAACYDFQSATVGPDGIGAGSLLWDNLGPLAVGAATSLDVTLTVSGECNPAQNTADVGFAVDENGDRVPAANDSAGLQTIGAKIGDRVWNDRDGDGVQDAGEGGIVNVVVFLDLDSDGSRAAGEPYETTDVNGAYDIADLAAGSYSVRVDAATLPAGAVLTGGSNPLAVTVAAGEDVNTADFGYQGNASIGDFIWHDANSDGNQDGGELGLGSVTVFLDLNGDGVLDAGEPFTVTDGSGNYDFINLTAGDYVVDVDDTTLPPNYVLTTGASTVAVTLAAGQGYNEADFGYRQQGGVNGHLFEDVDGDGTQDAGESDLAGIDVIITDSNGDQQTATTDANGDYQAFLPPGATTLDVVDTTLPPNSYITTANDPQIVTINAGVFIDSSDVGYRFTIPSTMKLRTGSYTGNAIAGTPITGLGFEPDLVIIKAADDTKEGVMRSASMSGDVSKPMGGATALTAGLIQSLDADGFTIGADDRVNKDTVTYHWIAFEAGDGEMTVDSYTGTGADNTSVSGVGFQPDYVMVLPAIKKEPVHRSSAQSGDSTMLFKNTASVTNHIQALESDGFQVGDDDRVNTLNETYHYIAWKEVAGKTAVGSYGGNDTDYTDISGLGFEPEYVIVKQDDTKEAVHRPDSLSGDNTLWFAPQSASADMIQELQSDGFQIGLDDNVNASPETYFWAAFAGSHLTISSAADQAFFVADPATLIQTITITEDNLDPTITAANDIRIRIPAGFNMTWDTALTTASIGGMAAAKVATAVTYEDGGRTLVLDVTSDFTASDQITVSLVRFNNFTAGSEADNLELEVDGAGTLAAVDDKTIAIAAPTISSAADQTFGVGDSTREIRTITIAEDSVSPTITAADDIRIRIPSGFNMTWDTLDLTTGIGGSAAGKVSSIVTYEDGGRTLVLDVTSDFAVDDQITIAGLSFENFSAISAPDNLELEVKNNGVVQNTDDKTIAIADLSISSADHQEFYVGGPTTAISTITVTDGTTAALISAANDIRIKIPSDLYMLWDTTDLAAVIGGSADSKVSTTVSYEDNGKTLVLDVTSDFAVGDQITIAGLNFTDFTQASYSDRLELEVFNNGLTAAEDDKWKAIGGEPSTAGSMLVYGERTVITPRYRNWQGAPSLSFSVEDSANNTDDVIKWVVLKPSPTANEMILGTYSSADKKLYIQTWDGTSWTSNWSTHLNYDGSFRMFDIAYEKDSGDAVVVFGDGNDNTLKYRKRVDGTWDAADQLLMTPDNKVNWVRAESRPGSDDIFVATVASSKSLYALRWDGSANSWGDQIQTTPEAGVFNAGTEGFDIAFESASGDAFLVWGDAAKNVKYREFTTGWQAETTAYTLLPDDVQWLAAAYDPQAAGSEIAIAMVLDNNTFEFAAWDGTSWVGRPAAITAPNKDNRFIDVAFESDTGQAVYGFSQNANADGDLSEDDRMKLSWRSWTSAGGFGSVAVEDGLSDEIKFVQLKADPNSDHIMAVYADKAQDLYHRFWDGASWTALAAPLEIEISDESQQEAFMFAWKESPPTTIDLISFAATGRDATIQVAWQTVQEIGNFGFNLYRSDHFGGPYSQINSSLIPGLTYSVMGKSYTYTDASVRPGRLYYYRLEDLDVDGTRTFHGPVCVDWDGDGMPDDWELTHGLNPAVNDAALDPDGDGADNLTEFTRGTDPLTADAANTGAGAEGSDPSPRPWTAPSQDPVDGDSAGAVSLGPVSDSVYKIRVSGEGLYRLSRDYLLSEGVAVDQLDLDQVRLYQGGRQVAVWVYDQNGDTVMDAADHITFYALPVDAEFAKYAAANVYWLTTGAADPAPQRMTAVDVAPAGAILNTEFTATVHQELDQYYYPAAPGSDELDRWFYSAYVMGDQIAWLGAGDAVPFALPVAGPADAGTLTLSMLGTYNTEHVVAVSVNGAAAVTFSWRGVAFYEAVLEGVNLTEGVNSISLTCQNGLDMILLDWMEFEYPRNFEAHNDQLNFSAGAATRFEVTNFSGPQLLAFDITDPRAVIRLVNFQTSGTGPYGMEMTPPSPGGEDRRYLVLAGAALLEPDALEADTVSNLADAANGADYIVITHRDLGWDSNGQPYAWLSNLASLRQAQGHRVKAVDLADIYDEFSFGLVTPAAVRDFLAYAAQFWPPPAPRYLLLVGDATYDVKDNWGLGRQPDVPGYLMFTEHMGETITDEWFGLISGADALPDLYIGRLPAATAAEAALMVNKIIGYESAANTKTWQKNIMLVADNRIADYEAVFEIMNEEAADRIPAGFDPPFKGYLNNTSAAALNAALQSRIDAGSLLVNYSGHASVQILAHENIFDNADVSGLTNAGRYPFFINMSCLTGYFAYPAAWNFPSLAEALLRGENKGAAAALMPTGQTPPEGQHILNNALFEAIFSQDIRVLGAAIDQAKQTLLAVGDGIYTEDSRTFLLFGDPAMELKVPLPHRPLAVAPQVTTAGNVAVSWQAALDCNGLTVAGYNLFRNTTPAGDYVKINSTLITTTDYTDSGVAAGMTYGYVVTALDGDGDESVVSAAVSVELTDSDADGLCDQVEDAGCSDALEADSDGDGLPDGGEDADRNGQVDAGETDPCNRDSDGDGLPDGWETSYGLNPLISSGDDGPNGDIDQDGWTNSQEYAGCAAPDDADSLPQALTVPALNYPASGSETGERRPWLSVSNATGADCRELVYIFEVYDNQGLTDLMAATPDAGLAGGANTTAWQVDALPDDNRWYYWRARAFNGAAYSDWMKTAAFFVNTAPDAPSIPRVSRPPDGSQVAGLQPALEVTNASDLDLDEVTYEFELYDVQNPAGRITVKTGVPEGDGGTTSWQIDTMLEENRFYGWRVQARDDEGLPSGWSSTAGFFVNTYNDAPTALFIGSPVDGEEVVTLTPLLEAGHGTDTDLDALGYFFEIDIVDTFDSPSLEQSLELAEGAGNTTEWPPAPLMDNTIYYWRVGAFDGSAYSEWARASFFVNLTNDAPGAPTIDHPGHNSQVTGRQPTLAVKAVVDADYDELAYEFELYGDQNLAELISAGSEAHTTWQVDETLADNRRYFWRARAVDEHGAAGTWSTTVSFFVNRANDAPGAPDLNNPVSGGTVTSLTPDLSVYNAEDPDQQALRYEFELYADPDLTSPVNAAGVSQQDLITSWSVPSALSDDSIYYWRARAGDGLLGGSWMPTAVFEVHTAGADTLAELETTRAVSARSQTMQTVTVSDPDSPICRTSLEIPPGGLFQDCRITIRVVTNPPALPARVRAVGRVIEFGPSGRHFAVPLTFRIAYRGADLRRARISQAADLEVFYYDTAALAWQKIEVESIDAQNQLVTFTSDHFSMYALGQSTASGTSGDDGGGGGGGGGCFIGSAEGTGLWGGWLMTVYWVILGIMGIVLIAWERRGHWA